MYLGYLSGPQNPRRNSHAPAAQGPLADGLGHPILPQHLDTLF